MVWLLSVSCFWEEAGSVPFGSAACICLKYFKNIFFSQKPLKTRIFFLFGTKETFILFYFILP